MNKNNENCLNYAKMAYFTQNRVERNAWLMFRLVYNPIGLVLTYTVGEKSKVDVTGDFLVWQTDR